MGSIPTNAELFDSDFTIAKELIDRHKYPWEVLSEISDFIIKIGKELPADKFYSPSENVYIARDAKVAQSASITGPCIIDEGAEIRQCAFIRGSAIVGKGSVLGNSCEMKNSILFDNVQVPHFNYIGDSLLGHKSHMGAGSITSNIKSDRRDIEIKCGKDTMQTGRKKIGAILGDGVEIGCNSVLCPGAIVGKDTTVYPLCRVRGVVLPHSIYKDDGDIVRKEER